MDSAPPDYRAIIYIVAAPEAVWAALTSPDATAKYFFGRRVQSDWRVGSGIRYLMPDGRVDVGGAVLEYDPPRRLSLTWRVEWLAEARDLPETRVTFALEPAGETVKLTLTQAHAGPVPEIWLEGGRQGWPIILSGLKSLLETGRVPNIPMPGPPK